MASLCEELSICQRSLLLSKADPAELERVERSDLEASQIAGALGAEVGGDVFLFFQG